MYPFPKILFAVHYSPVSLLFLFLYLMCTFCSSRAFADQIGHQRVALDAARKAFDLTSSRAGYVPNFGFDSRSGGFGNIPDFGNFGFGMPMGGPNSGFGFPMGPMGPIGPMGPNSAFAGAMAGPGFNSHKISLNPANPVSFLLNYFYTNNGLVLKILTFE